MPEPSKYVTRSDLGWGASPANYANPRSGLVIHYDSTDQNLAGKPHSECIAYWHRTRSFHVNSNGWADIGYCADEETEILTEDGWKHHEEINPGDTVLTLDHETGLSQWQPLLDVYVFPALPREMVAMRGPAHSSLTTPNHRWPVERGGRRRWATTTALHRQDRIPIAAVCADLPAEPKWSDAFVETMAWFYADGPAEAQLKNRHPRGPVILRSRARSAARALRTRSALHTAFGPAAPTLSAPVPFWQEVRTKGLTEFRLAVDAGDPLVEQAPDGVAGYGFLRTLTRAQLALFIEVSLLVGSGGPRPSSAGGTARRTRRAAEALQFAAVLAGYATSLRRTRSAAGTADGVWTVGLHHRPSVAPRAAAAQQHAFTIRQERYAGPIWCPRTPNTTWLARREGTVYFTGNSFMACPHGYVLEGRGLFKTQAAQPGGNTAYYSCTLAGGPSDPITDEQINAVREVRQWLMEPESSIAGTVKGHRDFISTSCPGDAAYVLVENGTFAKAPSAKPS